eukprot:2920647-Rhodomonas_salina.1
MEQERWEEREVTVLSSQVGPTACSYALPAPRQYQLRAAVGLRRCYAMSGADVAYAATRLSGTLLLRSTLVPRRLADP